MSHRRRLATGAAIGWIAVVIETPSLHDVEYVGNHEPRSLVGDNVSVDVSADVRVLFVVDGVNPLHGGAVTLDDVARHVGVSARTVSRVVNDEGGCTPATRDRILDAIAELGYRPNLMARG